MSDPADPTDDPLLKAALKRAYGRHAAPAALRDRVAANLESTLNAEPWAPPEKSWRPSRTALALAACLLIWVAAGFYYWRAGDPKQNYSPAGEGLVNAMARAAAVEPAGPLVLGVSPQSSVSDLVGQVARQLGRPVPTPDLSADGWELKTAAVVQLGGGPAGRFDFARAGHKLVLLSLPIERLADTGIGDDYRVVVNDRPMAGYRADGGMHCLVGEKGTPLADVIALRDKLRGR